MPSITWIGKDQIVNHDKEVPFRLLRKIPSASVGRQSKNLIIKGDNLEALKALMPYYHRKIKCIYIDPPYNTGNEKWVYNDKVNSPKIKQWLGKVVGDEAEDLCRHDKWLCMMYPRLKLLRELLSDDGIIFVSIDDNELYSLKLIMDEIFGGACFKNCIVIRRGMKSVQAQFDKIDSLGVGHEYVLLYTKRPEKRFRRFEILLNSTKQGGWNNHWRGTDRPTMRYELFGIRPTKGQWRWSRERSLQAIENYQRMRKELRVSAKEVTQKQIDAWYLKEREKSDEDIDLLRLSSTGKPEHYVPPSETKLGSDLWIDIKSGGSRALIKLLESKVFENPKPVELIKRIIQWTTEPNQEDIVLDSFAGTGTTAHAVLQSNKEDEGNRRFILVELEEHVAKAITAERVKRAIALEEYAAGFEFCELDRPLFDEDGNIDESCSFEQLAQYIYFTETQMNLDKVKISRNFIGSYNGISFYLIFEEKGKNILNKEVLKKLKDDGTKKIVYADKCLIDEETLEKNNIQFKQIPYEVKVY